VNSSHITSGPPGIVVVVVETGFKGFPFKMQLPLDVHTIQGALSPGVIVTFFDPHGESHS